MLKIKEMDFAHRWFRMRDCFSGKEVIIDRNDRKGKYKRMARGWLNYVRSEGFTYMKHFVLTQTHESYKPRIINDFMNRLRKRFKKIGYFWSIEIQEERLQKYGDAVLHWHIIVAFQYGTDFGIDEIEYCHNAWKYGTFHVSSVHHGTLNYVMKYVNKSLNSPLVGESGFRLRQIGCSQFPYIWRYSKKKFNEAVSWITTVMDMSLSAIGGFFKVDKKGLFYQWYDTIFKKYYSTNNNS